MEVRAQLNGIRLAPRKVRAITNLLKGKTIPEALAQLEYYVKRPAPVILKLINSGVANAENTYQMVRENLYIKSFKVNEGLKLKRYMPRGFGRASEIQKKTSHIILILDEKTPGLKRQQPKPGKQHTHEPEEKEEVKTEEAKPEIKRELGKKGKQTGLGNLRKLFNRKTIG